MVILVEDDGADVDVNRDNNKRPYFTPACKIFI